MPVVVRGEPVRKNEAGVWRPVSPAPERIVIPAVSFVPDNLLGNNIITYAFTATSRTSAGLQFPSSGVQDRAHISIAAPPGWEGKPVNVSFAVSAQGLGSIGPCAVLYTLGGGSTISFQTLDSIPSEDVSKLMVEAFTGETLGLSGDIGISFGRNSGSVEDNEPLSLNLEYCVVELAT